MRDFVDGGRRFIFMCVVEGLRYSFLFPVFCSFSCLFERH